MKYYKQDSNPLEVIDPGTGERAYDGFGNLIEIDIFGYPVIVKRTVLKDDERMDVYENSSWLRGFWAQSRNARRGNEIQDAD